MIILPAEQKINWRRPPLATLVLIALNLFVFFQLQSQDGKLWEEAYIYYVEKGLPAFEAPEYADYLQRVTNLGEDPRKELAERVREAVNERRIDSIVPYMLEDRAFVNYLEVKGPDFIAPDVFNIWQQQRAYIQITFLDQLSYKRMGLIPAEIQLPDLISYQFLHGGIEHLVGNMILLFIVGFALELILGKALYVIAFLSTGAMGGLIFCLTESHSMTPLVGASASISGLMGMYVMFYRLHKIRFFYFIVVYFNYFRAPALLILPVWLGKEYYEYYTNNGSPVAYMAHIGGLLAGTAFIWPWVKWSKKSAATEKSQEEKDLEYREAWSKALKAISNVEFDKARVILTKLHEHYPQDEDIALQLFHLYKLYPTDPECQHYTQLIIDTALRRGNLDKAFEIWQEYQKYSQGVPLADYRYHFRILTGCFNSNRLTEAETVLDKITNTIADKNLLIEAYTLAVQTFNSQELQIKSKKYQKRLNELTG